MTIEYVTGDIFEADVEAIVSPIDCTGAMGKGLALEVKRRFPGACRVAREDCNAGRMVPGKVCVTELGWPRVVGENSRLSWIVHFPTKRHWREKSYIEDIQIGLESLVAWIDIIGMKSIALPALGCGFGSLRWSDVRPLIEAYLGNLKGVRVVVYEPKGG